MDGWMVEGVCLVCGDPEPAALAAAVGQVI